MSVFWLQPQAWWGVAALAIPIAIHLLARQRSRRLLFPTLRFLRATRLAALRQHVVSDWPLLIVRLSVLTAAVAALAQPVFVSDARRAAWNQRTARAVIVVGDSATELVNGETQASFTSAVFSSPSVADGLRSALIWLERQPPAAQEVVIIGDLREGTLHDADLAVLPPHVGVRFLPESASRSDIATTLRAVADGGDGATSWLDVRVQATDQGTTVRYSRAADTPMPPILVRASPVDQAYADALLRAVLSEGVMLGRHADRTVTIAFAGAGDAGPLVVPSTPWGREVLERLPDVRGGEVRGSLVVVTPLPVTDPRAAPLVARIARLVFAGSMNAFEPRRMSAESLAAWSRPSRPAPDIASPADEGDRRWLWVVALVLLGVEQVLRRSRAQFDTASSPVVEEARVA